MPQGILKGFYLGSKMGRKARVPIQLASMVKQKMLDAKNCGYRSQDLAVILLSLEDALVIKLGI